MRRFETFSLACLTLAEDLRATDIERAGYYVAHAGMVGKMAQKTSFIFFNDKIELGKEAYDALKIALELNPYNYPAIIGVSKTIIGFFDNDPPQWVLNKAGMSNLRNEAIETKNIIESFEISQEFSQLTKKHKNQLSTIKTKINEIINHPE